jgi:DNA-directed RNA polymerase subunit M/transcription elongation factor TFIIS
MDHYEEGKKAMTCTKCGSDVTGKKFCPDCGTPVQQTAVSSGQTCPNCHNEVKPDAAFCIHCGSALHATASAAPAPVSCPVCHNEVAANSEFCTSCGHDMRLAASQAQAPASTIACPTCGYQNAATMRFCGQCGGALQAPAATTQNSYGQPAANPYGQQSSQYQQQPYGQVQNPYQQPGQYPQYQQAQQAPQYYNNQQGYQAQPMMGQGAMVLRCPVCMAMAPVGTPNCVSCHTSLAGVVPTPANMAAQGQQQGGFLQGGGGNMAMGALGGVAAVIGGEMLLHGIENSIEGRDDDRWGRGRRDEGLLGGLGNVIDDIGL